MNNKNKYWLAELEFKKTIKEQLIAPGACKSLMQTRNCIERLHYLIKALREKYDHVPVAAVELFNNYNTIQEKLLYKEFKKSY